MSKKLLITGGTGSFGSTILKYYSNHPKYSEIRIFSRDEKKQHELREKYGSKKVKFHIGDVRNKDSVNKAMNGIDLVFHAAALKQVPSCEFFPIEAVRTNILGSNNVIESAIQNHVKKVICLSTDKAAYPINAMGMTKAIMEKIAVANSRESEFTKICITRYGNVMASRGSVIPLFIDYLKTGKELTITDPQMTRFLMSLNEAIDLVEFAFENGENGELFIQKSPACTIIDLAESLAEIFDKKLKIKIIGKRHGEKMYETLATKEEMQVAQSLENYFRISSDQRDLDYSKYFSEGTSSEINVKEYNSDNTYRLEKQEIIKKLMSLDYIKNELK